MPLLLTKLMAAGLGASLADVMGGDTADGRTAIGTNQATAYETSTAIIRFTIVPAGTGCLLDNGARGDSQYVANVGANTLSVYPPIGHKINGLATNAAFSLPAGSWASFDRITDAQWLAASTDASGVGFAQSGTGATTSDVQTKLQEVKSVFDYMTAAEKADVIAKTYLVDVTTALQTAITQNLTVTGGGLTWPNGGYKITAALTIPFATGWKMFGASRAGVNIRQYTANTPIFKFANDLTHSWSVSDMSFDYNAAQGAANTAACPFYFVGTAGVLYNFFNFTVERVTFNNCCDCFGGDTTTKYAVWGWRKRDIVVGGTVSRSVWTYVPSSSIGMPNGKLDGCYVTANTMVGPVFNMLAAESVTLDNVEINTALLGPILIQDTGGGTYNVGNFKLEGGTYSNAPVGFFWIAGGSLLAQRIRLVTITSVLTANATIFRAAGGANSFVRVKELTLAMAISGGFNFYVSDFAPSNTFKIDRFGAAIPANCYLTNIGSSVACDGMEVTSWNALNVSANNGDADVTYTPGTSSRIQRFGTILTANRTLALPNISGGDTNNFNGLSTIAQRTAGGNFSLSLTPAGSGAVASFGPYQQGTIEVCYFRQGYTVTKNLVPVIVDGLTAFATGGQASATQLTGQLCRVSVCATGGDSVKLPTATGSGVGVVVINDGAASCNVFPQTGASIDALAANAALAVANGKRTTFYDFAANLWKAVPGA
jgi:hypothetical protein